MTGIAERAWPHVPLAVVERGGRIESVHAGSVAVVDADGRLVASAGDPGFVTFTRSSLKPLQALPFVVAGGPERFGLSGEQVALLCASHSGEARHQAAVAEVLARAGCTVADLRCGSHAPYVYDALGEAPPPPPYSPLGHNCSGKHAGMLACCVLHGWSRADYLASGHPLQQAIRAAIGRLADVRVDDLVPVVDGCSAPNYALPLSRLALAFARIASGHPGEDAAACRTLAGAMVAHPEYVSGTGGGDLALMRLAAAPGSRRSGPKACRRSDSCTRAWASRSRSPTAAVVPGWRLPWACWTPWGSSWVRLVKNCCRSRPRCCTMRAGRPRESSEALLSWTNVERQAECGSPHHPGELGASPAVCVRKRVSGVRGGRPTGSCDGSIRTRACRPAGMTTSPSGKSRPADG